MISLHLTRLGWRDTAQGRRRQREQTNDSTRDTLEEEGLALQKGKLLHSNET